MVMPETLTGHPARRATCRPILPNCVPWVRTAPHTTSSISPASMFARSIAASSEKAPKVAPGVALNAPLYARPMGVRAVETITASRIKFSSDEQQGQPDSGERRLLLAFDLDCNGMAHQQLPRRFLLDGVKHEAAAHAFPGANRREEAEPVEPVVDRQLHSLGN